MELISPQRQEGLCDGIRIATPEMRRRCRLGRITQKKTEISSVGDLILVVESTTPVFSAETPLNSDGSVRCLWNCYFTTEPRLLWEIEV